MNKNLFLVISFGLILFLWMTGFECASTEMTSAKLYIQQKNNDKALEALNREVAKNPKNDEAYYFMGQLYSEKEDISKMLDSYSKSLAVSKRFEKEIKQSKKLAWGMSFNKAVAFIKKAQNTNDKDSIAMNYEKSAIMFNNAITIEPDSAETYKNLSYVYLQMNKNEEAIAPLTKLISLNKAVDGYRLLGQLYYTKGNELKQTYTTSKAVADSAAAYDNYNKSIEILEQGKSVYPGDQEILLYLSNSYIAANKADIAVGTFKSGVEQDPKNKYYRYNYAVLLLGKSDFAKAEEQFIEALKIDPEYLNAEYNLAVTYVKWGVTLQKEADDAQKENPMIKEKYRNALKYLETYVQKKTDDAQTWDLIGKVYSVLSMNTDATKAFEKADKIRNK